MSHNKLPRLATAGLATAALFAGGCAPQHAESASSSKPAAAAAAPSPHPETAFAIYAYESSPRRVGRIVLALSRFGAALERSSTEPRSPWGPFDTYCSNPAQPKQGGWTSQGHRPAVGERCDTQHDPQYGGPNASIDAGVMVGPGHKLSRRVVAAVSGSDACNVYVSYGSLDKVPVVGVGQSPDQTFTGDATTLRQAERTDWEALRCLGFYTGELNQPAAETLQSTGGQHLRP